MPNLHQEQSPRQGRTAPQRHSGRIAAPSAQATQARLLWTARDRRSAVEPSIGCETTSIPICRGRWHLVHGLRTKRGALRAYTNTDYLTFDCPSCGLNLCGGYGISLVGSGGDLHESPHNEPPVLAFRLTCERCGLCDFFKIALDRHEPIALPQSLQRRWPHRQREVTPLDRILSGEEVTPAVVRLAKPAAEPDGSEAERGAASVAAAPDQGPSD